MRSVYLEVGIYQAIYGISDFVTFFPMIFTFETS